MAPPCELLPNSADASMCQQLTTNNISQFPWSVGALTGPEGAAFLKWVSTHDQNPKSLFEAMIAPTTQGGLGLSFEEDGKGPGRSPLEVFRDRKANCVEFVSLYLAAADLLEIPAVPMELFEDENANRVLHARIGILDPATGDVDQVADIANGYFGPPKPREQWSTLSQKEFLAYYYNLKGVRRGETGEAEAYVDLALSLNPKNYLILFNKAYFDSRHGNDRKALSELLRSISNYRGYPYSYRNLRLVAIRLGQQEIADWALEQLEAFTSR